MEFYNKKGMGWLTVRTGSMAPLIQPRDHVLISKVVAKHICCGDIVVFSRNGELIAHRVLKKLRTSEGISFLEKGDSSGVCRLFSPDDVIGRVTMVKGKGKILNLSSPFSRFTSRTLSLWFYWTSAIVTRLRASSNRNVRRVGRVLLRLLLLSSNVLVRICCVVWYLSGLSYRKSAESN